MPLSEKRLPRSFLSQGPKVGSQAPMHVSRFWGRGGDGTLASFMRVLTIFVRTGRPDLAFHKWNTVVPNSELRMTKLVIFPEQGQLGQKQFSVPKD